MIVINGLNQHLIMKVIVSCSSKIFLLKVKVNEQSQQNARSYRKCAELPLSKCFIVFLITFISSRFNVAGRGGAKLNYRLFYAVRVEI